MLPERHRRAGAPEDQRPNSADRHALHADAIDGLHIVPTLHSPTPRRRPSWQRQKRGQHSRNHGVEHEKGKVTLGD
eukprot:772620-Rhodomonas_salina.2